MVIAENMFLLEIAALIAVAAISDIRTRTIPNWVNAAIALSAVAYWLIAGVAFWPVVAIQMALAIATFGLFAVAFAFGGMGGGDVKLIGALALWLPFPELVMMLVIMSLAGGVLTLAMLVRHRLARLKNRLEVPYGIAISVAALWVISERYLNHLA